MKYFLASLLLLAAIGSHAQSFSRYIVRFRDKAETPFSIGAPSAYLSQRAIDRRTRYGIALDSTDLPLPPRYLDSVRLAGNVTVLNASKWLNQVSIQTSDSAALARIAAFPFVVSAKPIAARYGGGRSGKQSVGGKQKTTGPKKFFNPSADYYNYGASYKQIHLHNGEFLHNIGLRGQSMVVGVLDAGFYHYTTLKAFDSVNRNGQVLGVHDFVANDGSVAEDDSHGMECFSILAANIPGQFIGSAPKAGFYLFRSEDDATEYPIEEHNWVCAAERLDSAGGDVISSSLGYNTFDNATFDHTFSELDGNTTMAAIGADLAAKKGILVLNSAGNEGSNSWGRIVTPADADSILAVGAVNASGTPAAFTSRGPSADGQVKPDVASLGVGTTIQTPGNSIGSSNGTSFACPNLAGLATCLWQGFRELNNISILHALQRAGSRAASPNDTIGYGIPDMRKAVLLLLTEFSTATLTAGSCKNTLTWKSKDAAGMRYEIERKAPGETGYSKIGEREAAGGSFGTQQYSFSDSLVNIQAGIISYRIRQVIDTAVSPTLGAGYIDTVAVSLANTCTTTPVTNVPVTGEDVLVSPNPAHEKLTIRVITPYPVQQLSIRVSDDKGSTIATKQTAKPAGTATFELPLRGMGSGTYFLSIFAGTKRLATKEFMKL